MFIPTPCPICGRTEYMEARMCPAHGGKGVCIRCCKLCNDHDTDRNNPCGYYRMHRQIDYDAEIRKLNYRIEKLRSKVRYYYQRNWIKSAEEKEREINVLLRERRRLEEEQNERNN